MLKYSFPFRIWYMTVAWPSTVGSSASTAVTRMTEVPVERERILVYLLLLDSLVGADGVLLFLPPSWGRKFALCQRGHCEGEVPAMVGPARWVMKVAKRTGGLWICGRNEERGMFGLREKREGSGWLHLFWRWENVGQGRVLGSLQSEGDHTSQSLEF